MFICQKNTADPPFRGHCRQARSGLDCGPVPIAPDECHQKVDISEDCFTAMAQRQLLLIVDSLEIQQNPLKAIKKQYDSMLSISTSVAGFLNDQ